VRNVGTSGRLAFLILPALAGCLQIDTKVKLEVDGSATITERLRISKYLLDLDAQRKDEGGSFAALLSRQDAERRMKQMGKGLRLVSHKVRPAEGGSKESVTVYEIADLNDLVYASPLLAVQDYPAMNRIVFRVEPVLKSHRYNIGRAGQVRVRVLALTKSGKRIDSVRGPRRKKDEPGPESPAPQDLQAYRDVAPIFRDVMKGFFVRLRFETYATIEQFLPGMRGRMANVRHVDLISFSDEDLDRFGGTCLNNEEIMLDLVRRELSSEDIVATARAFPGNATVPVFLPVGSGRFWSDRRNLWLHFRPSRPLFKKLFAGKELNFARSRGTDIRPARFEEIGWQGEKK
jgi:hypothetical protein